MKIKKKKNKITCEEAFKKEIEKENKSEYEKIFRGNTPDPNKNWEKYLLYFLGAGLLYGLIKN